MIPSPQELSYFLEVAQTQNLSRAAERLGVSQPSVSLGLQRLEALMGTTLLTRTKTGVFLTPAGRQFHTRARELMGLWESLKSTSMTDSAQIRGHFRIGCHASVALYTLPEFLPRILKSHPSLEVKLEHDLSRKITERVIRLEVELGIVVNPVRHPDLVIRTLCEDEVGFYAGTKESAAAFQKGEGILICHPELMQTESLLNTLSKASKTLGKNKIRRMLTSGSLEVCASLCAAGAGVAILPGRVVVASKFKLQKIPNLPVYKDSIALIYRVEIKNIAGMEIIINEIVKSVV